MTGYVFEFNEHGQYDPSGKVKPPVSSVDEHNKTVEAGELAIWATKPERMIAYYTTPNLPGVLPAEVKIRTWPGTVIASGTCRVSRHNFGGRIISVDVLGTNGARYYGRASFDNGQIITLRRRK